MKIVKTALPLMLITAFSSAQADLIFSFDEIGSDVVMSTVGTLNTNNLLSVTNASWGGDGFGTFAGQHIIGATSSVSGSLNTGFGFNQGTDYSQWYIANAPFTMNNFAASVVTGTTQFATYLIGTTSTYIPGIALDSSDIINGLWNGDVTFTWTGSSFASLGLVTGDYTVSDITTNESITYSIGTVSVPEPTSLALLGLGLAGFGVSIKKKTA